MKTEKKENNKLIRLGLLKKKSIGKKGLLADIGEMVVAGLVIAVLGVIILLVVNFQADAKNREFQRDINIIDSSFNTRSVLQHEIEPGYRLYDFIIDAVNSRDYSSVNAKIAEAIEAFYGGNIEGGWVFAVNNHVGYYDAKDLNFATLNSLPRVEIPNPDGDNILVLIKKVSSSDYPRGSPSVHQDP